MKSAVAILVILNLMCLSCSDRGTVTESISPSPDLGKVSLLLSNPPNEVALVVAKITRSGFNSRTIQLSISDTSQTASGTFTEVPLGLWHLAVEARDTLGVVRYSGETDVNVVSGQLTHVTLHLSASTGGIQIEVTWGEVSPLNEGLVAYYSFTGNTNDESGLGNHGTSHGAMLTNDRFGNPNQAYAFNGVNDYVEIPHAPSLQPSTQLSICAWVKPAAFYTGLCQANDIVHKGVADHEAGCYILRYTDNTNTNDCYQINNLDQHFEFWIVFGDYDRRAVKGTRRVHLNEWQFVVGTFDGSIMKLYVNGVLDATFHTSGQLRGNTRNLFIGKDDELQYPYPVNGDIDEVRIYRRALSQAEVVSLYSQTQF